MSSIRLVMDRLGRLVTLAVLAGLLTALPAQAAAAKGAPLTGGSVTVEYSGKWAQSFVYQPSNPSVWQGSFSFNWDETATFDLPGKDQAENPKLVKATLTVGGNHSETFAPPNSSQSCSATFSLRKGGPIPISIDYNAARAEVDVHALLPDTGMFVQGSDSNPSSHCYVPMSGGVGFTQPQDATQAFAAAEDPLVTRVVPSNPYSKDFTANGSDDQVMQSFHAVLEVNTNGKTSGRLPIKLTPAEVQAKKNALNALKETLPASLYPCISLAAGTTLLAPTAIGVFVGAPIVYVSQKVCSAYYSTIMAELNTVKDPPRGDYSALAPAPRARPAAALPKECRGAKGAARNACITAAAATAKLLADLKSTESAAKAIATTIAREVGAQHAGNRAAASRQDKHLNALAKVFAARRRAAIGAGKALAGLFTQAHASLRLNASQYGQAESVVLAGLAKRGTQSSHVALARRLLHGGSLNVLRTLGR
ncbi:MAG: hypothetical protein ACXVFA_10040 [Solirubrobacteraceae bacterium]